VNLGDLVAEGSARLCAVTDAPRLEAEMLLAHASGLPRTALLAHPEYSPTPTQQTNYQTLIRRRASGFPLPYLTGRVQFYDLEFAVTPGVLIPRPETEALVGLALERRPQVVLDVGTGSGCIAVTLAVHLPNAQVFATDLSTPALRLARANARHHRVHKRVRLVRCDLAGPLRGPFDLAVSNPPYIAREEWGRLPASVRQHEPHLALDGGSGGLAVIRRLLAGVPRAIRPGGRLLVEIGAAQGEAVLDLARSALPDADASIHHDLAGRERVLEVKLR